MTTELVVDAARKRIKRECDLAYMRKIRAASRPDGQPLVGLCLEMGWQGLLIGEPFGGFGYGLETVCALLHELGQVAFPQLFISHFVAPALLLGTLADSPGRDRALQDMAEGRITAAVATNTSTAESFSGLAAFRSIRTHDRISIDGVARSICDLGSASHLLLPAWRDDGQVEVYLLEKEQDRLELGVQRDQAYGRTWSVSCTGLVLGAEAYLGTLAQPAWQAVFSRSAIAQSALLIGSARGAMAFALAHIMVRKQFGKLLAEFQAVQHQAADMYRAIDVAQLLMEEALAQLDGDGHGMAASCCKAWAGDAGCQAAATSHQLMGGTGYMVETNLHLLTTLVLRGQYEFGSSSHHRERVADLVCTATCA